MRKIDAPTVAVLAAILWLAFYGGTIPGCPAPFVTTKATAATYVWEKDKGGIPAGVMSGLNKLNVEKKILATEFEEDTKDGTGETPEQYKVPLAAAKDAGVPALVVTANTKVLKVVKDPKTEEEVLGAVP